MATTNPFIPTPNKQVIVNKHNNEAQMNRYWTDLMSGVQLDALPAKDISFVRDFLPLVQSITVKDLQVGAQAEVDGKGMGIDICMCMQARREACIPCIKRACRRQRFSHPPYTHTQLVLGTLELDESKICTCTAISDTPPNVDKETPAVMVDMQPQHIMPGGGRGVPIA